MSDAHTIARGFVAAINAELPGLVRRVYVTGSAGTDDWHHGRSDVDLVVELSREAHAADASVLTRLHAQSRSKTVVDGIYLTTDQLAAGPDAVASAPQSIDGRFALQVSGAQLTWVTWMELEVGRSLDGDGMEARFDDVAGRAARASRENLRSYWLPLGRRAAFRTRLLPPFLPAPASAVAWVTLGPPRLIVTIEDHVVVTKSEAGRFAAQQWPQFAPLLERVLEYRASGQGRFTVADARSALALLRACVERGTL